VTDTAAPTAHEAGDAHADPTVGRPRSGPTREQLAAWRAFLRAHASITRALEAELVAEQELSLASYDVLVQLAEAPERRLRMTELADAVLLSRSGVTRLVDRLEKGGLVARCPVESDGRGVAARLTDAGYNRLRTASRTHLLGIAHHFAGRLDESDLRMLERISRRLAG
jgi:DNA-binding MarR family transcriptional regulator